MKIRLNDRETDVAEGTTIQQLLEANDMLRGRVATTVNNEIVKAGDRATYMLSEGDSIIVIKAFYGG